MSQSQNKLVTIVIPVYNESLNVQLVVEEIVKVGLKYPFEILFVNDGSNDVNTLKYLQIVSEQYPFVKYLSFVKNFGHQLALKAGLDHAKGDCVISMDGDLQHPPAVLPKLIEKWDEGYEIVITKRVDYGNVGALKKASSAMYYKIINLLSSIPIHNGESDFRLIDKRVAKVFRQMNEIDPFFRGLSRWVGFKCAEVEFSASDRIHGKSKYSFKKMLKLGLSGILSFSSKPLYVSIYMGFFSALCSVLVLIYVLFSRVFGHPIPGWSSMLIITALFSGVQLITMGIFGLYLSRVFIQSKNRPLYIVGDNTYDDSEE